MTEGVRLTLLDPQRKRQEVSQRDRDIVADLRQALVSRIGNDRFDVWFQDQADFEYHDNRFTIFVHNEFRLDQVRRTFGQELREVTREVLGVPTSLSWQVRSPESRREETVSGSSDSAAAPSAAAPPAAAPSAAGQMSSTSELEAESLEVIKPNPGFQNSDASRIGSSDGEVESLNGFQPSIFSLSQRNPSCQVATGVGSGDSIRSGKGSSLGFEGKGSNQLVLQQDDLTRSSGNTSLLQVETYQEVETCGLPSADNQLIKMEEPNRERATTQIQAASVQRRPQVTLPTESTSVKSEPTATQQRFRNFVRSESTELAFTAAAMIPRQLGQVSPLFLHGPTGSGKTHLLRSIITDVRQLLRKRSVLLSAEQFTSSFLSALHGHGLPSFRRKHRNVDLLLIDDVQFFVGKRATLIELFHTIDALTHAGKQIVLTSDRPPNELNGLGAEIVARLSAGLVCPMDYTTGEDRIQLIESVAFQCGLSLERSVLEVLAQELPGDARLIRGALNRLKTYRQATGLSLNADQSRRVLGDLFQANQRPISIGDIERAVCEVFGVNGKQLRSDRKSKAVSQPRMLAMWLARKHTRAAYSEIGEYFGGRSHSTVISANNKVKRWVNTNEDIQVAFGNSSVSDAIRRIETSLRAM